MKEKDTTKIPKGSYCYTYEGDEFVLCPYYKTLKDRPVQYNGYCEYLEKGDIELEKEMTFENECGEIVKGNNIPFPVSLLWDQCKECGINNDDEL